MKTKKNLIRSADEYTRYYGDFRGVDFSTEHTAVNERRFAYALNMYKDYRSGEGTCVETIPGFRRRLEIKLGGSGTATYPTIYGIHEFTKNFDDGTRQRYVFIHADDALYHWTNFGAKDEDGNDAEAKYESINQYYGTDSAQFTANEHPSKTFTFNNKLYFIDGNGFYVIDAVKDKTGIISLQLRAVSEIAYVPTVYKDIPADDLAIEIKDYEYEQKNLLSNTFKHTYTSQGGTTEKFHLYTDINPNGAGDGRTYRIIEVKRYGVQLTYSPETVTSSNHYYIIDGEKLQVSTPTNPNETDKQFPELEITYEVTYATGKEDYNLINKCTVFETFDRRIFLSGNPDYPNHVWWCGINSVVGLEDPTYFGELNYVIDGVENAPITALMTVADSLAVLKNNAKQDGSIYLHKRYETGEGVLPVTYPSEQGLGGYGCLGACINFFDDPIFISKLGVEAIGQLSVRLERAVEHRSTLVDAKLANLNLSEAQLTEWNGYLILLVGGQIFMADSRQPYTSEYGTMQYEWYYLDGIGVWHDQEDEYYYAANVPNVPDFPEKVDGYDLVLASNIYDITTLSATNLIHSPVELAKGEEVEPIGTTGLYYVVRGTWDGSYTSYGTKNIVYKAIICESLGSKCGGEFKPATVITTIDDNIFFGTKNGVVCSFNFDKRNSDGSFGSRWYSFDDRTIYCGVATKLDNCGIPHLTKSTIKKSTVIKSKAMGVSVAKVRVRTNKDGYKSIARLNNRVFSFDDMDFSDFSFSTDSQTIFAVREKEKHWVEKQHWIYSDEYQKPFSLNYLAFRYKISGRIKG